MTPQDAYVLIVSFGAIWLVAYLIEARDQATALRSRNEYLTAVVDEQSARIDIVEDDLDLHKRIRLAQAEMIHKLADDRDVARKWARRWKLLASWKEMERNCAQDGMRWWMDNNARTLDAYTIALAERDRYRNRADRWKRVARLVQEARASWRLVALRNQGDAELHREWWHAASRDAGRLSAELETEKSEHATTKRNFREDCPPTYVDLAIRKLMEGRNPEGSTNG